MSFIRVKKIKKYRYAYVVSNVWRKRLAGGKKGSRQRVSRYLGRVATMSEVAGPLAIKGNEKKEILQGLIRHELEGRGFKGKMVLEKEDLRFDMDHWVFLNRDGEQAKLVLEINEGFLCTYTLRCLLRFRKKGHDERTDGIALASLFLEAGLRIPQDDFVRYFEMCA